jgi:hypothetical protein
MNVYELTIEQKDSLIGKAWCYDGDGNPVYFNPQPDADNKWFVSTQEVEGCTLAQAVAIGCDSWLLSLPLIPYNPIIGQIPQ